MRLTRQHQGRTGRATGRKQMRRRETWSGMVMSPASAIALTKRTGVAGGVPCC
jgi:hypothetical protein